MNHFISFICQLVGIGLVLALLGLAHPAYADYVPDGITTGGPTETTGAGSR